MRSRRVAILGGLLVLIGVLIVVSATGLIPTGPLDEMWVSDTQRENQINHHAIGASDDGSVIVAPVAEVPFSGVPITNTSCALVRLAPENGSVLWRTGVPADACFTHALTQPAIADLDSDGSLEVVVSTTEHALITYDAQTGAEHWRVPLSTYGYGQPTITNISDAPGLEVVTSDIDGGVVATRADGTVLWRVGLHAIAEENVTVLNAPRIEDVDGDGSVDIVIGTNRGTVGVSPTGTIEWVMNGTASSITTVQADADPAREILIGEYRSIRAYDGATREPEWTRQLINARFRVVSDADADGTDELIISKRGGSVSVLDVTTGDTVWTRTLVDRGTPLVPRPVVGDVTGDGREEIIVVLETGTVHVLNATSGDSLAHYHRDTPIRTFATPADIDRDGADELLIRYGDGRVVALDYRTATVTLW